MKKSKIWILILILFLTAVSVGIFLTINKKDKNETILYPVQVDGKWGYIDKTGKIAIEPKYAKADDFYNGVAIVQLPDASNVNGDTEEGNGVNYGAIDSTGKLVVKPEYSYISKFNEGIAGAIIEDKETYALHYYILNKKGKILFTLPDDIEIVSMLFNGTDMPTQSEGLILVRNIYSEMYGFMDCSGKMIIPCKYYEGYYFSNGLALVKSGSDYQYIDKTGKVMIDASKYTNCRTFSEGLAAVAVKASDQSIKYGYIDTNGNMKIKPEFSKAYRFSDGLAKVCTGESINQYSIGYIDETGAYKIGPDLQDNIEETLCTEDLAAIDNGAGGYRNKEGKLVIDPVVVKDESNFLTHNVAGEFRGGIAKVNLSDGRTGYIDTTGRYIWQPSN